MEHQEILGWLRESDPDALQELGRRADRVRQETLGPEIHLRGLVELSNYCQRNCAYCGLRKQNQQLKRYRLDASEILDCADQAARLDYGTLVLQSGEDRGLETPWLENLIHEFKSRHSMALTLSLGERSAEDFRRWRKAGADRYLMRFETSDSVLYHAIHPDLAGRRSDRLTQLRLLRSLGYEIGSGVMVGLPGQSINSLADDLLLFRDLDLDMIGIGPWLSHPATPLAQASHHAHDQAPATAQMVLRMIALCRILCPQANIPATTALATQNSLDGREHALKVGANVLMPNVTPSRYRALYEIYPDKVCITEEAEQCQGCLLARILSIGRVPGKGMGSRSGRQVRSN